MVGACYRQIDIVKPIAGVCCLVLVTRCPFSCQTIQPRNWPSQNGANENSGSDVFLIAIKNLKAHASQVHQTLVLFIMHIKQSFLFKEVTLHLKEARFSRFVFRPEGENNPG